MEEGNLSTEEKYYGANAIVDSLINHDVKFVFGIPGAKSIAYLNCLNILRIRVHQNLF